VIVAAATGGAFQSVAVSVQDRVVTRIRALIFACLGFFSAITNGRYAYILEHKYQTVKTL
jgi:hypothetical protein